MSFTDQISTPSSELKYWVKLYPKFYFRHGSAVWTLHSGSIYKTTKTGLLIDLTCSMYEGAPAGIGDTEIPDPILLSKVDSVGDIVSPGEWSYDSSTGELYIRALDSGDPNDNGYTLESIILSATHSGNYHLTPNNTGTDLHYWEGNLIEPPKLPQSLRDQGVGFIPSVSSTLRIANSFGSFYKYSYDFDWKNVRVLVFQDFVLKGQTDNPRLTISGIVSNININNNEVSFTYFTFFDLLNNKFSLKLSREYSFTGLKPEHENLYVRRIYGRVLGFKPIQLDYNTTPATNVNRNLVVSDQPVASHPVLSMDIDIGGTNNATTTTVVDAEGFAVGDSIVIQQGGVPAYGAFITAVNYNTNVITHTAITAASKVIGDKVKRGFVSNIIVNDTDGSRHYLAYERDWSETNFDSCAGIDLVDNFEANHPTLSGPFDPDSMELTIAVYGTKVRPTLQDTSSLGEIANEGGAVANPVSITYSLISEAFRSDSSLITSLLDSTFVSLAATVPVLVGFAVPETQGGEIPSFKEILVNVLNSYLGRVVIHDTSSGPKFGVNDVQPTLATPDFIIDDSEILSFEYLHDYEDQPSRLDIVVQPSETIHISPSGVVINKFTNSYFNTSDQSLINPFNGIYARRSYFTKSIETYNTYLWHPSDYASGDISTYLFRILFNTWQRKGLLTIETKHRFIECEIGNTIQVNRDGLPGFEFIYGTEQSRKFILLEKAQGINGVTLVLSDQRGVEDESGSW